MSWSRELQTRPGNSVFWLHQLFFFLDQFPEWLRSQTPNESFPGCHCGSAIWACRSCRSWWRCPPFALLATSSSSQVRIWLIWLGLRGSWQSSLGPRKEKLALLMKFPPQRDIDWDYLSELVSWLKQTLRNLLPYTVSTEFFGISQTGTNWRVTFLLFFGILFGDAVRKGVQKTSFLAHHWKTTALTNSSIWLRQNDPMWFVKFGSLVKQCNLEGHTPPQTKMKPPLHAAPPAGVTQWSEGDGSELWGVDDTMTFMLSTSTSTPILG